MTDSHERPPREAPTPREARNGDEAPVIVSACLLGLPCRYDAREKGSPAVIAWLAERTVLPVCPETAAGLGVPRAPFRFAEANTDGVLTLRRGLPNEGGEDVAPRLVPACETLASLAAASGASEAVLKARSPSCGVDQVDVAGVLTPGRGVFAALLERRGLRLRTEEDVERARNA